MKVERGNSCVIVTVKCGFMSHNETLAPSEAREKAAEMVRAAEEVEGWTYLKNDNRGLYRKRGKKEECWSPLGKCWERVVVEPWTIKRWKELGFRVIHASALTPGQRGEK